MLRLAIKMFALGHWNVPNNALRIVNDWPFAESSFEWVHLFYLFCFNADGSGWVPFKTWRVGPQPPPPPSRWEPRLHRCKLPPDRVLAKTRFRALTSWEPADEANTSISVVTVPPTPHTQTPTHPHTHVLDTHTHVCMHSHTHTASSLTPTPLITHLPATLSHYRGSTAANNCQSHRWVLHTILDIILHDLRWI